MWTGQTKQKRSDHIRYGVFCAKHTRNKTLTKKINIAAHRLAYFIWNGAFDWKLHVLHHCDTPLCVNPAHLYLGTNEDNIRDKVTRGRATGNRKLMQGVIEPVEPR